MDDVRDFSYDIKIADGYKRFSQELLRLSLLALTGCAIMWLKLKLPEPGHPALQVHWRWLVLAFCCFAAAAGCAAAHLYVSNDALAELLIQNRKLQSADVALRNLKFRLSSWALMSSATLLLLGVVLFLIAIILLGPPDRRTGQTWNFAVAGDSRNCGDVVMPEIARSAKEHNARFYWHLGDFRWISNIDEDMALRPENPVKDLNQYKAGAWNDFIENQVLPFGDMPVYLGIGNHETYLTTDRKLFTTRFSPWMPPGATASYFHWRQDVIDFIYLDNATNDQFDKAQQDWLDKILAQDSADESVRTIVVGMHAALPNSISKSHDMDDWPQGETSGRAVYDKLFALKAHKQVYLLASHSHYYSPDAYDTTPLQGRVLPGWIVGTAGAQRYSLPFSPGIYSDYGYLLAKVNPPGEPEGTIHFAFKAVPRPADTKKFGTALINYCFQENRVRVPAAATK